MRQFLSLSYWFKIRPGDMDPTIFRTFLGVVLLMFLLTGLFFFLKRIKAGIYKKFFLRLFNFFLSNTIIGGLLVFFTFERLAFLSMRFWPLLWFISMALWLGFIAKDIFRIPEIREKAAREREFKKYLPQ